MALVTKPPHVPLLDSLAPVSSGGGWMGWMASVVHQQPWMVATFSHMRTVAASIGTLLLTRPLAYVYLHGPRQLYMWGGLGSPDICAALSGSPAEFWNSTEANRAECDVRIARDFHGWLTLFGVVTYYTLLTVVIVNTTRRLWWCRRRRRHCCSSCETTK
jgi:hypothetical protein